jgi:hypothetical protein
VDTPDEDDFPYDLDPKRKYAYFFHPYSSISGGLLDHTALDMKI